MKPNGLIKRIMYFRGKVDNHPKPKKEYCNWWEDFSTLVSRTTLKKYIKKQITKDIEDEL